MQRAASSQPSNQNEIFQSSESAHCQQQWWALNFQHTELCFLQTV